MRITANLERLVKTLFPNESDRKAFLDAMEAGQSREGALIVLQDRPELGSFPKYKPEPWQPEFVMRLMDGFGFRPSQHPLYAQGAFYSLDFSSVFAASAMLAIPEPPRRVLDLCSAPGGKAIFAWRAFHPELLACNEVIRKRTGSLIDNLQRCGISGSLVTSADASVWARKFPGCFDLVIVDAPCSGQSLIAKGDEAPGCFSPQMIDLNVGRQRRITGNAVHCLRPGGHLLYMTCTFTPKENEKVIEWLLKEYDALEAVAIPSLERFRTHLGSEPAYRLFPHYGIGAGAFAALLRVKGEGALEPINELEIPASWRYGDGPRNRPDVEQAAPMPFEPTEPRKKRQHFPQLPPKRSPRPVKTGRRGRRR